MAAAELLDRAALVRRLVALIDAVDLAHPTRVAVDGPDAAGKTTLADELEIALADAGRDAIRASVDGFHRSRVERYRLGPDSPEGYYEDSFDYRALRASLLDPLGPSGSLATHLTREGGAYRNRSGSEERGHARRTGTYSPGQSAYASSGSYVSSATDAPYFAATSLTG